MNKIYLGWILGILTLICAGAVSPEPQITIQISNPYSFDVDAEIKCDWDNEKQDFNFKEFVIFRGNEKTRVDIPRIQKSCEIWPRVKFFN